LKPVSANLENLQLTQVRDAVRETGYLLQQAQPIFLHSFIISHDWYFVEGGGDVRGQGDYPRKFIHGLATLGNKLKKWSSL